MLITRERDFTLRRWDDIFELDWFILGPAIALLIISGLLLSSAADGIYFSKQFIFFIPAVLLTSGVLFIRIKALEDFSWWVYGINILLLFLVLIMGNTVMGSQRWINLGFINIQPSEIAKIAMIISLASWFSKHPIKNYFDIFISGLIIAPPFLLIFKQPDLGTSLAYIAIYLGMAFWAGATITHLLVVISPLICLITNATGSVIFSFGTVQLNERIIELTVTNNFIIFLLFLTVWLVINLKAWKSPWVVLITSVITLFNFFIGFIRPILWNVLHSYQQRRLTIFLNPESDPLGAGYHIVQSLLAIGNGGLFGYGWLKGRLTRGNYVPAQHTDFVFSTAGEEFGFIGSALIIVLFFALLVRILYIAKNTKDNFASLLAVGIFSFFLFHIFINVGMTIGIMPITGVPLPLLSYGGSALVVDLFSVFLVLSISWKMLPKKLF